MNENDWYWAKRFYEVRQRLEKDGLDGVSKKREFCLWFQNKLPDWKGSSPEDNYYRRAQVGQFFDRRNELKSWHISALNELVKGRVKPYADEIIERLKDEKKVTASMVEAEAIKLGAPEKYKKGIAIPSSEYFDFPTLDSPLEDEEVKNGKQENVEDKDRVVFDRLMMLLAQAIVDSMGDKALSSMQKYCEELHYKKYGK
jgi:hypothetical protein